MMERYAYRCLPPYRGVAHVVVAGETRAITHNGRYWQIQIEADSLPARLRNQPGPALGRRITLGHWQPEAGLDLSHVRHVSRAEALAMTERLVAELAAAPLPCPLDDRHELWLLDRSELPLALLNTQREPPNDVPHGASWQAFCGEYGSVDMAIAHALQRAVRHATNGAMQWFLRRDDGSGQGGMGRHIAADRIGRIVPPVDFPTLTLRDSPWDEESAAVLSRYLQRLAPRLLMLPLGDAQRAALEAAAIDQPEELWTFHRAYPRVLNPAAWTAAFVGLQIAQATASR
jgi:hypothetical protein